MEQSTTNSLLAVSNLALVMIGNILGGTILVALVSWFIYLRADGKGLAAR